MYYLLPPGAQVDGLFQDGVIETRRATPYSTVGEHDRPDVVDRLARRAAVPGVRSTLPDELLLYPDKLSMAHDLELRVPYVDKEIIEYVEPSMPLAGARQS
jgi:asparagine synthase (glutamine-hydrolysing)